MESVMARGGTLDLGDLAAYARVSYEALPGSHPFVLRCSGLGVERLRIGGTG